MTRLPRSFSTVLVVGGLFALTACSGGASSSGASSSASLGVGVTSGQLKFDKPTLTAKAAQSVTVTFTDSDPALGHSFVMDQPKVSIPEQDPASGLAPGKSGTATFTAPTAGSYQYYCGVPGHKEAGMVGTLQVTP